ncbi:MAG: PD-(D/E)XK nuclease family protein [Bacillus sp. (in: Bacteria)]|nr:PD-(D/E)XK nuclease family protein [Bacillus sp. (in: firmicutes)]
MEEIDKLRPYCDETINKYEGFRKVNDLLLSIIVNQSLPKPGHLHVTSYKKGVYVNRKNVFIIGLDNKKFPGGITEDPLLLDEERTKLNNGLPLLQDDGGERLYNMLQVIANTEGELTVSYCNFDVLNNRAVSPAHIFLQCFRMKTNNPYSDFKDLKFSPYVEDATVNIDKKDFWNRQLVAEGPIVLDQQLLESHENLIYGMAADVQRGTGEFTAYDGHVSVNELLDPRINNDITMSAGKLEKLAQCPYAYFLQEILKIRPIEDITYDENSWLSAAERGSLLHQIFELFYKELGNEKPNVQQHEEKIISIANKLILEQKELIPPPSERVLKREERDILLCSKIFLKEEEIYCEHYDPEDFEYTFGLEGIAPASITLPSGESINVAGKIDRIDKSKDGHYHIIDYKTGSTYNYHDKKPFKGGRQLQHFIYALAIEQHLHLDEGTVYESSYYFPTAKGLGERYTRKQDERLRETGLTILEKLIDIIRHGHFTMTDDENDCKFCDYKKLCRRSNYNQNVLQMKQMSNDAEGIRKFKGVRIYE